MYWSISSICITNIRNGKNKDILIFMKHLDTKYSCYKYIYIYGTKYLWYSKYRDKGSIKINIYESLIQPPNNDPYFGLCLLPKEHKIHDYSSGFLVSINCGRHAHSSSVSDRQYVSVAVFPKDGISTLALMIIPRAGKTKVAERMDIKVFSTAEFEIGLFLLLPYPNYINLSFSSCFSLYIDLKGWVFQVILSTF